MFNKILVDFKSVFLILSFVFFSKTSFSGSKCEQVFHNTSQSEQSEVISHAPSLKERKETILALMNENPLITADEMAEKLGLTTRTIYRSIKELKQEGRYSIKIQEKRHSTQKEERKQKILDLIKEKPHITQNEIAKKLGLARLTINQSITELKQEGRLFKQGGRYSIKTQEKQHSTQKEERKQKILTLMNENPLITLDEIAEKLELSRQTVLLIIKGIKQEKRNSIKREERKETILALMNENPLITPDEMAEKLGLTARTIYRSIKELKQEGRYSIKIQEKRQSIKKEERKQKILALVNENPNITQIEMTEKLGLSRQTIYLSIKELKQEGRL